jgi:hypothetical protein
MFNSNKKGTMATIKLNPGKIAPRYEKSSKELILHEVVITEKGMESGLPLIDFVMKDSEGKEHYFMISGRIVNMISSAIKGVNLRNHGQEEP